MNWVPFPWAKRSKVMADGEIDLQIPSVADTPVLVRDLIGKPVRVLGPDDMGTADFRPNRVNIKVDANHVITDIAYG